MPLPFPSIHLMDPVHGSLLTGQLELPTSGSLPFSVDVDPAVAVALAVPQRDGSHRPQTRPLATRSRCQLVPSAVAVGFAVPSCRSPLSPRPRPSPGTGRISPR